MSRAASTCVIFLAFLFCAAGVVFGQGTDLGTIRGTVTDSTGAVIPGATVTVTDALTKTARETRTNSQGNYEMFGLRPGTYKVTITAAGMSTKETTDIILNGSDTVSVDAVLKVSAAQETVVVSMEAPAINTENQTISTTISNQEIIDLPRDSRDVYSFLYLNPNITQGVNDGEFKFLGFQSYGANFTLDGQRSTDAVFGVHTQSEPSLEAVGELNVLSNDFSSEYAGIANIRVTTKRGESQFHGSTFYNNKNSALAALQIQDKQGMRDFVPNQFVTSYPTPYFNYNDLGGSLGGPIPGVKKTWFFTAYERNYARAPVNIFNNKLPHPAFWGGDFSLETSKPALLPDVPAGVTLTQAEIAADTYQGAGQQFVTIPSRLLNPDVQKLISTYFPKISTAVGIDTSTGRITGGFQTLLPGGSTRDVGTLRGDHDFTAKDHVYVVYNVSAFVGTSSPIVAPFTGLGLIQNDRRNNTVSGSYVRIIHDNLINELRGGFNREYSFRHSITTLDSFLSSIGFDSSDINAYAAVVGQSQLNTHGHTAISYGSSFVGIGSGGRNTERPLSQYLATFGDTLTWVLNKHNLKMGADVVRNVGQDGFASGRSDPRGTMTYANPTSCQANPCFGSKTDPFTDLLLGLPPTSVTYVSQARPPMDVHNWEQGYFFQDDWKMTPRLTINLGLRYELISPFIDKNDILLNFDPTGNNGTGRIIVPSSKTIQFLDPRIPASFPIVPADKSGLGIGRGLVRTDKNNFAPRIGVALRVGTKSVVRGGYGIYFPTAAAHGIRDPLSTNAFNQRLTKTANPTLLQPWPGFSHGFSPLTGGDLRTLGGAPSINAVPVGLHQPMIHQYNATYERELGLKTSVRLSYIGVTSKGLVAGKDLNELKPSNVGFATTTGDGVTPCDPDAGDCLPSPAEIARLPFPALGDFLESFGNFGHGQSNIFQTQVERRYASGFMFNASYSYVDQKSTGLDTGNDSLGGIAYNPFNPDRDYGTDAWVSRHRFVLYGLYDLPVGRGKKLGTSISRWADAVVGGWQTTFQMFAKSGTAFTPFWSCDNCQNSPSTFPGNIAVSSVAAVGDFSDFISFRPLVVGNYNHHVGDQLFDPNAFAPPTVGADVFDNSQVAKRNLLWGPGAWGVNFGLHKEFRIAERVNAVLGADFNNLFNHPLRAPNQDFAGGGGTFAYLGGFNIHVDPNTLQLRPITSADISPNPDFGRAFQTFSQEGVDSRRTVRLRLRITF